MPKHGEKPSFSTFLGIVLTSNADSEIAAAARQARRLLKAEGLSWHDVGQAIEQRRRLLEAAKALKSERDELLAENTRLKSLQQANGAGSFFAQQLWQPAGMPLSVDNKAAMWVLDLHAQGRVHLTSKEEDFVTSCARRRRLSDLQREWLEGIVKAAINRTGITPPP